MIACNTSNRIRYYYENILRYDLLLKLNYNNIMEVPRITKIIVLAQAKEPGDHVEAYNNVKKVSLTLEIMCGQKVNRENIFTRLGTGSRSSGKHLKGARAYLGTVDFGMSVLTRLRKKRVSASQPALALLYCSLRAQTMYNFLEKLISFVAIIGVRDSSDYKIKIKGKEIQVNLSNREIRLFPEIQNHFEVLAEPNIQAVQIKLVTSASNEKETQLLWTGLQQKEI